VVDVTREAGFGEIVVAAVVPETIRRESRPAAVLDDALGGDVQVEIGVSGFVSSELLASNDEGTL